MNEADLIAKLLKIEALHAGATSPGERDAAESARERILARMLSAAREEPLIEYKLSLHDPWNRRVFMALARRYEIKTYRYRRQHRSTVQVRVTRSFMDGTLWPEYTAIADALHGYLDEVTQRVIAEAIHGDSSDAEEQGVLLDE